MILLVDDDMAMLDYIADVLLSSGFPFERKSSPEEALSWLESHAPSLVICDVMMPAMSGLEMRESYVKAHPERDTPFIFLSSIGDPTVVVQGLDQGAEDYLLKPIAPEVLLAKVRHVFRRLRRKAPQVFRGSLATMPLADLFRYCEAKGLTGYMDIFAGAKTYTLRFVAGRVDDSQEAALDAVLRLTDSPFELRSEPLAFDDLPRISERTSIEPPSTIGRISGVRLNHRLLQVQTQVAGDAEKFIVTIVTIDGKIEWKRRTSCNKYPSDDAIQKALNEQHQTIEQEVEEKLLAASTQSVRTPQMREKDVLRLCDDGYDKFRAGDYDGAIRSWTLALQMDPNVSSIAVNLKIAKDKREKLLQKE